MKSVLVASLAAALVLLLVPTSARAEGAALKGVHGITAPVPLPVLAPGCPLRLLGRTPQQVWNEHLAALQAGDFDRAMCDYAWDARVLMPGTVLRGFNQVKAGFLSFNQLVGNALPTVTSVTIDGEVVFSTFTLQSPLVSIPDGADTFVVRFGLIHYQTVHASLSFNAP